MSSSSVTLVSPVTTRPTMSDSCVGRQISCHLKLGFFFKASTVVNKGKKPEQSLQRATSLHWIWYVGDWMCILHYAGGGKPFQVHVNGGDQEPSLCNGLLYPALLFTRSNGCSQTLPMWRCRRKTKCKRSFLFGNFRKVRTATNFFKARSGRILLFVHELTHL